MNCVLNYSCRSHRGLWRKTNQDNLLIGGRYIDPERESSLSAEGRLSDFPQVVGVFDGLGGEECGEQAARIAAEEASRLLPGEDPEAALAGYCREANRSICRWADENGVYSMGTTAAMLLFTGERVGLMNIGDSRIFRLSRGRFARISVDHVTDIPGRKKPPLSQNLGIPEDEFALAPRLASFPLVTGDKFLLCSDGLTDMVPEERIKELFSLTGTETPARALMREALINGGRDNVTVAVVEAVKEN